MFHFIPKQLMYLLECFVRQTRVNMYFFYFFTCLPYFLEAKTSTTNSVLPFVLCAAWLKVKEIYVIVAVAVANEIEQQIMLYAQT